MKSGMRQLVLTLPRLLLVLLLILTGQSMAVARGASGPAGQMILCTGTGPVQVFVDEEGQPTAPPRYCPDCALTLLDHVAPALAVARKVELSGRIDPVTATTQASETIVPRAIARAPPCDL